MEAVEITGVNRRSMVKALVTFSCFIALDVWLLITDPSPWIWFSLALFVGLSVMALFLMLRPRWTARLNASGIQMRNGMHVRWDDVLGVRVQRIRPYWFGRLVPQRAIVIEMTAAGGVLPAESLPQRWLLSRSLKTYGSVLVFIEEQMDKTPEEVAAAVQKFQPNATLVNEVERVGARARGILYGKIILVSALVGAVIGLVRSLLS